MIMVRIGTEHYPVAEVMARRYPDLGFDRGKRGKRRRWYRGYWVLLAEELKKDINSVGFYVGRSLGLRITFEEAHYVVNG